MKRISTKKYPSIGCCGIDCGLCPTHHSTAKSKCPGCDGLDFYQKHPSCSIITCCVKKKGFEVCSDCEEFPCLKIKDWDKVDSFVSHKNSLLNLKFIQKNGIAKYFKQQHEKREILEQMLEEFNEGRSRSFFCLAVSLLPVIILEEALKRSTEIVKKEKIGSDDLKSKSKILKDILNDLAKKENISLKLRKSIK